MKNKLVFIPAAALLLSILVIACFKETDTPEVLKPENSGVVENDASASDRWSCSLTVNISGGMGLRLCGNLSPTFGNNCSTCSGTSYGAFAIESNNQTVTMLNTCFALVNNTGSSKTVTLSGTGGTFVCVGNTYTIPAGQSMTFCISKVGNCCKVLETPCE
jgi:hypothetical protein